MIYPFIMILAAGLIVAIGIVACVTGKVTREEYRKTGKYPKGHYRGVGIALGVTIGTAIGVALDLIAIGPAIGIAIGIALGNEMEKQHADELRELTKKEKEMKKITLLVTIGLLGLGMLASILFFLKFNT